MPKSRADYEREWREGIQAGIERANKRIDEAIGLIHGLETTDIGNLKIELAVLKREFSLKSGLWGLLAGLVPGIAAVIYVYIEVHK